MREQNNFHDPRGWVQSINERRKGARATAQRMSFAPLRPCAFASISLKQPDDIFIVELLCQAQRGHSAFIRRLDVGAMFQQQPDGGGLIVARGVHQRRAPIAVCGIDVTLRLQQRIANQLHCNGRLSSNFPVPRRDSERDAIRPRCPEKKALPAAWRSRTTRESDRSSITLPSRHCVRRYRAYSDRRLFPAGF